MVALPNPSIEPETHRWRPGAWAPSREVRSQNCAFCASKQPFLAQNRFKTQSKRPNEAKPWLHCMCRLTSPCQRAIWCPSTPRYVREMAQKGAENPPKSAQCAPTPRNQARAVSWATWLKIRFGGHLVHSQPPTFCGFHALESPNETPRAPYQWSLGAAGGQRGPRTVGAKGGSTRVPGAKKRLFPKLFLGQLGCSNRCFQAVLSPWWRVSGHGKSQNALKLARFGTKNWVKNGSKQHFFKSDPGPFGILKQVVLRRFEPLVTRFCPCKIPKCLEIGPFWDQKWVKNGSKSRFCKSAPSPFGMLKQVF